MKYAALSCFLVLVLVVGYLYLPSFEDTSIYSSTLRLHVIANSDADDDQTLKLLVRNEVVSYICSLGGDSFDEAVLLAQEHLDEISCVAAEVIVKNGYDYPISVTIGKEIYPTREYDDFSLPAGEYTSLQIRIGDAVGQNWWCVLYPPICLSPATSVEVMGNSGFSQEQIKIITESERNQRYRVKFKILEYIYG